MEIKYNYWNGTVSIKINILNKIIKSIKVANQKLDEATNIVIDFKMCHAHS
jgi:hypothetical protein